MKSLLEAGVAEIEKLRAGDSSFARVGVGGGIAQIAVGADGMM